MERYDYYEAIKADIKDYIDYEEIKASDYEDFEEMNDKLYDDLWTNDNVTGNASGSYTFNTYLAEEYLCHNMDLLEEACDAFGCDMGEAVKKGAEHCDVTIRCYLLGEVLREVLEEYEADLREALEDEDEEDGE